MVYSDSSELGEILIFTINSDIGIVDDLAVTRIAFSYSTTNFGALHLCALLCVRFSFP